MNIQCFKRVANLASILSLFSISLLLIGHANAKDLAKGLEIATEVKKRDIGWTDTTAHMQMILRGPSGDESVREIRVKTLEVEGDGDKAVTIFDQPRDIAGTAFLSFSKTNGADDQWIYLPAAKRVKRISTRNKSSPFMGSEFAYEDMTSFELEKFTFAYLRDETIDGVDCFVVEQIPTDKYSGYKRQVVWIDKEHYRAQRAEFYDRKDALLKILRTSEFKLYLDKYWRALRADMVNQQTGKSTTLLTSEIQFKSGLKDKDFDKKRIAPHALEKINNIAQFIKGNTMLKKSVLKTHTIKLACAALAFNWCMATSAYAEIEISGSVAIEQRLFLEDSLFANQNNSQASLALAPEFETGIGEGYLTFKPFLRLDQRDEERTHFDVRELMYAYFFDNWEVRAGIGRVFWGQTESLHLVDVINQTDFVESIDGEDKLGQPMLDVRYLLDTGAVSFYVLPYFRERTFPGEDGRLRGPMPIDTDNPIFESEDENSNVDFALRWQQSIGDLELGIAYFDGTSRLPDIKVVLDEFGGATLVPYYQQLQQFSLDALYVYDSLLIKVEAISGETTQQDFNAYVAGIEYTVVNFYETGVDLGLLLEHQFDERDQQAFIYGQNDLMIGARLQLNDFSGSQILFGFVRDLDNSGSYSSYIEGSMRLNQNWRLEVNAYMFSADVIEDQAFWIRRDDHISLNVEYYF